MRGVRGLKELKALHAAKEASMAAQIQVLEDAYAASMLLLNFIPISFIQFLQNTVDAARVKLLFFLSRLLSSGVLPGFLEEKLQHKGLSS